MHLYDRIQASLFQPLVGKNGRRTWDLLVRLMDNFFGPEVAPDHPDGQPREDVVKAVERFLKDNAWEAEEGDDASGPKIDPLTPLNIQSNMLLSRLVNTGWLVEDRVGVRRYINMRPVVARLHETLQQFAVEEPQLISGEIQLIHSQLQRVLQDPEGQAPGFVQSAKLVVGLIQRLSNTTLRVRDLMKELMLTEEVPAFIEKFFRDHIEQLYVRDFRELRTANHPLRLRFDILSLMDKVTQEEPLRSKLLQGYAALPGASRGAEEEALERDIKRFQKLLDVERHLQRLDHVIQTATQRAVAYISYRLRASDRIEWVIRDAIDASIQADTAGISIETRMISQSAMISEQRMRLPAPVVQKAKPTGMAKPTMSAHQKAEMILRKSMLAHRDISPASMRRYIVARIPAGQPVKASDMPIETVADACAFLGLVHLARVIHHSKKAGLMGRNKNSNPLLRQLGFEIVLNVGEKVENEFFETEGFTIVRAGAGGAAANTKSNQGA